MLGDERVSRGALLTQCVHRALLVLSHQPRIPGHIGGEDRGKAANCSHSSGIPALRSPAKYVASINARIFGANPMTVRNRARLE